MPEKVKSQIYVPKKQKRQQMCLRDTERKMTDKNKFYTPKIVMKITDF